MKNVLVIHYSQSGQLSEIATNIAKPLLENPDIDVSFHTIEPVKPYPFPWNKDTFFNVFPESFLQIPTELKPVPLEILNKKYDLILFSYQVWYLTPSIPTNSFLKSFEAKKLFENTDVVTIIACRNMWALAQEKVKKLIRENNGNLKGNLAFIDKAGNLISVITIVDWMFSGIKKKYLGIFPLPGVSQKDIDDASKFGKIISESLNQNNLDNLQEKFVQNNGVYVSPYLVSVDKKGNFIFNKWSKFINSRKKTRSSWLKVFYVYLFLAIWVISPIVYILHVIMYPFTFKKRRNTIKYYQSV